VFRVGDNFYALPNVCVHQFGPLCHGQITGTLVATEGSQWQVSWVREGQILICPWHALEFDITTGQCLARDRRAVTRSIMVRDGYAGATPPL
jgi:nitrite reductase/ring-hydroxylating ferredoxin subunit